MSHGRDSDDGSAQDSSSAQREPYAGISQSILIRLFANPSNPHAARNRVIIHRLFVAAWVVFALGFLVIVAAMIAALVSG
ncbi:hypothetical protein DOE76_00570 [Leifsonia sp. ku-ls]|nr:hypothetical protein DOE76_00570 [Leifsonia sp. ku-ls]